MSYSELIRERIKHLINSSEGVKSYELLGRLVVEFIEVDTELIKQILLDLVHEEEIIEIEYIIRGKSRSFFLPKIAEVRINI